MIDPLTEQESTRLCDKVLTAADAEQFDQAVGTRIRARANTIKMLRQFYAYTHAQIKRQYWYQLEIDDLPVWGMVGEVCDKKPMHRM